MRSAAQRQHTERRIRERTATPEAGQSAGERKAGDAVSDGETTDSCSATITGAQRADLATTMRVLRMHPDPAVRREALRIADVVVALYDQLILT